MSKSDNNFERCQHSQQGVQCHAIGICSPGKHFPSFSTKDVCALWDLLTKARKQTGELCERLTEVFDERDELRKQLHVEEKGQAAHSGAVCKEYHQEISRIDKEKIMEMERERDRAMEQVRGHEKIFQAEMDGNMELRKELGARPEEGFPDFVRRIAKERDELKRLADSRQELLAAICLERDHLKEKLADPSTTRSQDNYDRLLGDMVRLLELGPEETVQGKAECAMNALHDAADNALKDLKERTASGVMEDFYKVKKQRDKLLEQLAEQEALNRQSECSVCDQQGNLARMADLEELLSNAKSAAKDRRTEAEIWRTVAIELASGRK